MLDIDIGPAGKRAAIVVMTIATNLAGGIVREISRSDCNCVGMVRMTDCLTGVAVEARDHGAARTLRDHFANSLGIHPATNISVAGETASVQRVNISCADQAAGPWGTQNCGIAGVAGRAGRIDGPVIVGCCWDMVCWAQLVTGIAGDAAADRRGHLGVPDGIIAKRTTAVTTIIMTGGTADRLTGGHVVASGQDRIKIMTRQNVASRSNLGRMADGAGDVAVRDSHSTMQTWP